MARHSTLGRAVRVRDVTEATVRYEVLRGNGAGGTRVIPRNSFLSMYDRAAGMQAIELERESQQATVARLALEAAHEAERQRSATARLFPGPKRHGARLAKVKPGSVWRAVGGTGRTIRVTEVDLDSWTVSYVKVRGTGPAEKTVDIPSLINGYRLAEAGRQVTSGERYELRHLLQELSEYARSARNAVEPETGVIGLSTGQWEEQWEEMKAHIDAFTRQVLRRP
jgi:hypothetical protein